jgi:hypothetical protein
MLATHRGDRQINHTVVAYDSKHQESPSNYRRGSACAGWDGAAGGAGEALADATNVRVLKRHPSGVLAYTSS